MAAIEKMYLKVHLHNYQKGVPKILLQHTIGIVKLMLLISLFQYLVKVTEQNILNEKVR